MDVICSLKNCKAKSAAVQVYRTMSLSDLLYRLFVHKMSKKMYTDYHCTLRQKSIKWISVKWGMGVHFSGRCLYDKILLLSSEVWVLSYLRLRSIHIWSLNWWSVSYHLININLAIAYYTYQILQQRSRLH